MRGTWQTMTTAATTFALCLVVQPSAAQQAPAAKTSSTTAAKVDGEVITLDEVEQGLSTQLRKIEEQRYALIEGRLQQLIGDRLLAREARKRGLSIDQLLTVEVDAKTPDLSDEEVTTFITQNRSRLPQGDEADLKVKVRGYLRRPKIDERRQVFIQSLFRRSVERRWSRCSSLPRHDRSARRCSSMRGPRPLTPDLVGHDLRHVVDRGRSSKRHAELLPLMLAERFTARLTVDESLEFQQNGRAPGVG